MTGGGTIPGSIIRMFQALSRLARKKCYKREGFNPSITISPFRKPSITNTMTTRIANKAKLEALLTLINTSARDAIALYEQYGDLPSINQTETHPLHDAVDQIALKSAICTLEGACAQICTTLAPPAHTVINLVQAYDYACLRVVLRENISDILLNHPKGLHINELSKKINIEPKKLSRTMRLLAMRGCYNEVDMNVFSNNRLSLVLLNENPLSGFVFHVEIVAKGAAVFSETRRLETLFDWMAQHDGVRESFHTSMGTHSAIVGPLAVLTLVDVGGGIGAFSMPLAKVHKDVKITIQDLPEVLVQARGIWAKECPEALAENRVEFEDLNFFEGVPVKGKEIYYASAKLCRRQPAKHIIHDWPDRESLVILSNVRKALGSNSRLLIHDYVLRQQVVEEDSKLGVVSLLNKLPHFENASTDAEGNYSIISNDRYKTPDLLRTSHLLLLGYTVDARGNPNVDPDDADPNYIKA
ncbi:S-adenosyl-L-methionine-dependent methyltransferase [Suillus decipiens]|nr:S-adenosyl-L-methionine-dependent methyltransferase [Suillus decipiens]